MGDFLHRGVISSKKKVQNAECRISGNAEVRMQNAERREDTPVIFRNVFVLHSAFIVLHFFFLAIYYQTRYKPRPWYQIFVSVRLFASFFLRGLSADLSCISARG
jgi:hypothetical protein